MKSSWHELLDDWSNELTLLSDEIDAELRLGQNIGESLSALTLASIDRLAPIKLPLELLQFYQITNGLAVPGFGKILPLNQIGLYSRMYPKQHRTWTAGSDEVWFEDPEDGERKHGRISQIFRKAISLSDDLNNQNIAALLDPEKTRYWIFDFHQPEPDCFMSALSLVSAIRSRSSRNLRCQYGIDY